MIEPAGLLLTGGSSRRLGVDKASLVLDGETLAVRAARLLSARCANVVEVGPGVTDLPVVREEPAGSGPLAALIAGFVALTATAVGEPTSVVLLACDLPWVEPALDAIVAAPPATVVLAVDHTGRRQYACARYGPAALRRAATLLAGGEQSLRSIVASFPAAEVVEIGGFAPEVLSDIDDPEDARRAGIDLHR